MEWHERYEIGVESIDHAHKEIFRVISRLRRMMEVGGKTEWAAAEALKYLKNYVLKHFDEEEAFMLAIDFRDYAAHKAIHDGMRDKIVPRLYSQMVNEKYSGESIRQFLNVCETWFSKHILGHDREFLKYLHTEEEEKDEAGKE